MTTAEMQHELYEVLKAHKSELELRRGVTSADPEVLDRRIEAIRLLLEWLSRALELEPPVSPAVQKPPPSSALADQHQTPPSAPDPPKTSSR